MSDAQLVDCPQCGAATFKKQLTSAGFQLKGSGWYVTDFRDNKGPNDKAKEAGGAEQAAPPAGTASEGAASTKADTPTSAAKPATASAAPPAAPSNASSAASPAPSPAAKAAPAAKSPT